MKTIALAFSLLATVGCSTRCRTGRFPAPAGDQSERHGTTAVHAGRAKALVSGPALIRHLEQQGATAPWGSTLPTIPASRIAPAQARARKGGSAVATSPTQSRLTNLTVPAGKRMCVTTYDPTMRVAWHVRTGDAPVRSVDVALLSR